MRNVSRLLDIEVEVVHARIEDYKPSEGANYITSRALAPLGKLLSYSQPLLLPTGRCIFLKGATADEELTKAKINWIMHVRKHVSVSDSGGVILDIGRIKPVERRAKHL